MVVQMFWAYKWSAEVSQTLVGQYECLCGILAHVAEGLEDGQGVSTATMWMNK